MKPFNIILNYCSRFAVVLSVFVGGVWLVIFIEDPTWEAARWAIFTFLVALGNGFFGFGGWEKYCSWRLRNEPA